MIVGFTGTRDGMTRLQEALFVDLLARLCPDEFHHGDCLGADAQAHQLVQFHCRTKRCAIVIHPPEDPTHRAFCVGNRWMERKPYLVRNRAIVACCDELVAAPKTMVEELRSGTWATIRYARQAQKPLHLLMT